MSNLMRALFDFKGRENSYGCQSDPLMMRFALRNDDSLLYDRQDKKLRSQRPLSIGTLKERIAFVEKGADLYFKENNIEAPDLAPLSNGAESLVFNCNNGYVLKIRTGQPYQNSGWNRALNASMSDYSERLNVTYGIYPMVQKAELSTLERMVMCAKATCSGYYLSDPNAENFGYAQQGGRKKLMMIDDGAVRPIRTGWDVFDCAKGMLSPIYLAMPFLHKPYRHFRDTVKEMLGMPQAHKIPPLGANAGRKII